MKKGILLFISIVSIFCCDSGKISDNLLQDHSWKNSGDIERIIEHYPKSSERRAAAVFLLENMGFHHGYADERIPVFRDRLFLGLSTEEIGHAADSVFTGGKIRKSGDAEIISAELIIKNIDLSFEAWENAPWKNKVSFRDFCEYILPYRVADEPLADWRSCLREKYRPLVEGVTDPKNAYDTVYRHIIHAFTLDDQIGLPYTADPLTLDRIMRGNCSARCVYMVAVMRSLSIPCVMDKTPYWANYSNNGHSWVAYVDAKGRPYVTSEWDSISARDHYIDASFLPSSYPHDRVDEKYGIDSVKKIAKIYRNSFSGDPTRPTPPDSDLPKFLTDPTQKDVSGDYHGMTGRLKVIAPKDVEQVFLCIFTTEKQWHPIAAATPRNGRVIFRNLGNDIVYLLVCRKDGALVPLSNPVVLSGRKKRVLNPDRISLRTITIDRKYLLLTRWINRWGPALNGRFEVSDVSQYNDGDTILLHTVDQIPVGPTVYRVDSERPYRFVRFRNARGFRVDIAELEFFNEKGEKLTGTPVGRSVDRKNCERAFDGDPETFCHGSDSYWIGLDLGEGNEQRITEIRLTLADDRNFIDPGDRYELMYYDRGWRSHAVVTAAADSLTFADVPDNTLLWLRNHTKGKEERIFTYENGRQIWW